MTRLDEWSTTTEKHHIMNNESPAILYLVVMAVVIVAGLVWARSIGAMHSKHPEYRGEDLFDEDKPSRPGRFD